MFIVKELTIGEIARRLNCPIHRVNYLISSRNIMPIARAGKLRIFSGEALEILREELKAKGTNHASR